MFQTKGIRHPLLRCSQSRRLFLRHLRQRFDVGRLYKARTPGPLLDHSSDAGKRSDWQGSYLPRKYVRAANNFRPLILGDQPLELDWEVPLG